MINSILPESYEFLFETGVDYKVIYGGRDSAKTTSVIIALLILGKQEKSKILCCREFQNSVSDSVKSELDKWIDILGFSNFYRSTNNTIVGKNGTEFLFYGIRNNPTKIKSIGDIKYCYVEEAESISQRSWDILEPTIRIEGSQTFIVFNPYMETDPTYVDFVKVPKPRSIIRKVNFWDNPFLSEKSKRRIKHLFKHDHAKYLHIYEGEFVDQSETMAFTNWTIGETMSDAQARNRKLTPYFGLDLGFSSDPTALVKCYVREEERELHIVEEAYEYGVEIDHLPGLIETVTGAKDNYITADSSRPETISHLNGKGLHIRPSKKGPNSIIEGIEFIRNFKVIINSKCRNAIYEFSHYSHEVDQKTGLIKPTKFVDKDNHLCFVAGTKIETFSGSKNIEDITTEDYVAVRQGYKKVIDAASTGCRLVKDYSIDNTTITCTPDHPIITNEGKVPIDELKAENTVYLLNKEAPICELKQPLLIVEPNLLQTSTLKPCVVREYVLPNSPIGTGERKEKVYNITVEDEHEYFANGILVSNCDALRYALELVRCNSHFAVI